MRNFLSLSIHDADLQIVQRKTHAAQLVIQPIRRQTGNSRSGFRLTIHHVEISVRRQAAQFQDALRGRRSSSLKESPQARQWDRSNMRAPQQDVVNRGYASER